MAILKVCFYSSFPITFVTDCLKKSEKLQMWCFTVGSSESLWRHVINYYVTMVYDLTGFGA